MNSGYVHESIAQSKLTSLCLEYLSLRCFTDVDEVELEGFALSGHFAFQDYAIAEWSHHFLNVIEFGNSFNSSEPEIRPPLKELEIALEVFSKVYQSDILSHQASGLSEEKCQEFRCYPFYESLLDLWRHINHHRMKGPESRNTISRTTLSNSFFRTRQMIERLSSGTLLTPEREERLTEFYGSKRFKCHKLQCPFFHEGFSDAKGRDEHIARHERPYNCTVTGCSFAEFGFILAKDLEKHKKKYHPELFTDYEVTFAKENTGLKSKAKWQCMLCDKSFVRGGILRDHMRAHNGERPHCCPHCGKTFTRSYDCTRHVRLHYRNEINVALSIMSEEPSFVALSYSRNVHQCYRTVH